MLIQQTMDQLYAMKLHGLAAAWQEQQQQPQSVDLDFDERFALLIERQWLWKENRALVARLKYAGLRHDACLENIDFRHPRGLQRATINQLAASDWVRHRRHCLITGPTGVGKSYIACALAHKACRDGFRTLYFYLPKLIRQLLAAQADGSLTRLLNKIARADLMVVDDWGLMALQPEHHRLFLEILEDRQDRAALLITSQYPVDTWHERIGDPTVADAILDRLVSNAYTIELQGASMRPKKPDSK